MINNIKIKHVTNFKINSSIFSTDPNLKIVFNKF